MAYFTVTELRDRYPELDAGEYPDERVEEVRAIAEESFEDECGVAFEPRERTDTLSGDGSTRLLATRSRVRSVSAITDDGDAVDLTDLRIVGQRTLYLPTGWTAGYSNLEVTYMHGYDAPPARVKQAVMLLTKVWLINGPLDERATSVSNEDGTFALLTPGLRNSPFGIPEVDAAVARYSDETYVS